MPKKKESGKEPKPKTPLQEEKKQKVIDIADAKAAEKEKKDSQVTPKRTYRKRRPKVDPEAMAVEAQGIIEILALMRRGLGVDKPIPDHSQTLIQTGYVQICIQYGPVASRYMPLIIFGAGIGGCLVDTWYEAKKIAIKAKKEALAKREQERVIEAEKTEQKFEPMPKQKDADLNPEDQEYIAPKVSLTSPDVSRELY